MAEADRQIAANPETAYERSDWSLGPIAWTYGGCLLVLGVAVGAMILAYPHSLDDANRKLTIEPPSPRLQLDPAADLAALRAQKEAALNSYRWIDKQKGIVHIPIEQAMQKIAKSGIDGFPKAQP